MRSISRTLALTLTLVILSSSIPAFAAPPREPGMRDRATVGVFIKRAVKRILGITTQESITVPIPSATKP